MTPEEHAAIENTVELAVKKGNEPLWAKLRDHDTDIALHKQDMRQSKDSQIAQGGRLGEVEKKVAKFATTTKVIWGMIVIVACSIAWLISLAM